MNITVIGTGGWGTALAVLTHGNGQRVTLWGRLPEEVEPILATRENQLFLPGVKVPATILVTLDTAVALREAEMVVLAVPSHGMRPICRQLREFLPASATVVHVAKGIENETGARMSEVIAQVAQVPADRVAVVSGPNLAREIAQRQPAATTVACSDGSAAQRLQDACTTGYFRPYWTTDVVGVEIGGAVKNVIALANGMAVGMGFGENAQAGLITRGLVEMTRLGVALGAAPETFLGLAGIGDLIATCSSPLSRNRTFGENLGRGLTVDETMAETKQTCEGVKSCQSILDLATRHEVDMPITEQVVNVVHHGMPPADMLQAFMSRETKAEGID